VNFEIYHQLGHNAVWNIDSLINDGIGNGMIISPRSMTLSKVMDLDESLRSLTIFDPQISNPHEVNEKMRSYDFYPSLVMPGGFNTDRFGEYTSNIAEKCVDFQLSSKFSNVVIPTRYFNELPNITDFIKYQQEHYINPFLKAIKKTGNNKEIILQLILNGNMVKSEEFRTELLNWITGIEEISGVYLITELKPRRKQIDDIKYLYSLLKFTNALYNNELKTILGYLNSESILISISNPSILTIGSFENLRIFDHARLLEDMDRTERRGPPNTRVYVPFLLDWIEQPYIETMIDQIPDFRERLGNNEYITRMLDPEYHWYWNKPEPYKHFFIESSKQLREVGHIHEEERYHLVSSIIESARTEYSRIEDIGIVLDDYGSYLPKWLTAANLFAKEQGWRS